MRSTNALHHADLLLRPSQLGWKLGKNFCSIMPEQRSSCGGFVGCHDAICLTEVVEHKRATSSLLLHSRPQRRRASRCSMIACQSAGGPPPLRQSAGKEAAHCTGNFGGVSPQREVSSIKKAHARAGIVAFEPLGTRRQEE